MIKFENEKFMLLMCACVQKSSTLLLFYIVNGKMGHLDVLFLGQIYKALIVSTVNLSLQYRLLICLCSFLMYYYIVYCSCLLV